MQVKPNFAGYWEMLCVENWKLSKHNAWQNSFEDGN